MSQQATHSPAFVTRLTPEPEVKEKVEPKQETFDEDISLEEGIQRTMASGLRITSLFYCCRNSTLKLS